MTFPLDQPKKSHYSHTMARKKPATSHTKTRKAPTARSRITNGKELLPDVDGRSVWARLFRDERGALIAHAGGEDRASEPQRMLCRRAAALEAELVHFEAKFAATRAAGDIPTAKDLDLYSRLASAQRRVLEAIGIDRKAFDAVPSLDGYLQQREAA